MLRAPRGGSLLHGALPSTSRCPCSPTLRSPPPYRRVCTLQHLGPRTELCQRNALETATAFSQQCPTSRVLSPFLLLSSDFKYFFFSVFHLEFMTVKYQYKRLPSAVPLLITGSWSCNTLNFNTSTVDKLFRFLNLNRKINKKTWKNWL